MSANINEEMSMEMSQEIAAIDSFTESMLMDVGAFQEESEEPEHPTTAALRAQIESGLTPEQVTIAAAVTKAIAGGKQIVLQVNDGKNKWHMMYKNGQFMGHNINEMKADTVPQYAPGDFPVPDRELRMLSIKGSKSVAVQTPRDKESAISIQGSSKEQRGMVRPAEKGERESKMMKPHSFKVERAETDPSSGSESPKAPPLIDEEEEARNEARIAEDERIREESRVEEEKKRSETIPEEIEERRIEVRSEAGSSQSRPEDVGGSSVSTGTAAATSLEENEEKGGQQASAAGGYRIPKKTQNTQSTSAPPGSFQEAMMSMDMPMEVAGTSRPSSARSQAESEDSVIDSEGQYQRDLRAQWKMVYDDRNPARRPWRWNMTIPERREWI